MKYILMTTKSIPLSTRKSAGMKTYASKRTVNRQKEQFLPSVTYIKKSIRANMSYNVFIMETDDLESSKMILGMEGLNNYKLYDYDELIRYSAHAEAATYTPTGKEGHSCGYLSCCENVLNLVDKDTLYKYILNELPEKLK